MKEKCFNHPDRKSISFCHSCGKYYCEECLSVGKEYYYCKAKKCQLRLSEENRRYQSLDSEFNSISKKESREFFKKAIGALFALGVILTLLLHAIMSREHPGVNYVYLSVISFAVCGKLFIIIYFMRILYKHFFWEKKLREELSKSHKR